MEHKKIAILHTSFVFVSVELIINELIAELIPDAQVIHFVDSDVLTTVQKEGFISDKSAARMTYLAQAAEAAGADIIFSACSSLGPALDTAQAAVSIPVVKIDESMALKAATDGARIAVMATVPSTLEPTSNLILKKAQEIGKNIEIEKVLADGAFALLLAGNREEHDQQVIAKALNVASRVDLIVLSQASMNRLAPTLAEKTGIPVLSSPRLGVNFLKEKFDALK